MAETSWIQSLLSLFKSKAVAPGSESCLEFSRQCLKEVRAMISHRDPQSSEVLNYRQCAYLIDSLDEAVRKASSFLEHNRDLDGKSVSADDVRETTLEPLKVLCMLAKKVKCFIEGCCNGHWLRAAVMLPNLSHCTTSMGFELKLFIALIPPSSASTLSLHQVSALRHGEGESVKQMASIDEDRLVTKLRALIQYGQASSKELELATFVLERLNRLKQSFPSPEPILLERDLANLKPMVQIGSGTSGTLYKTSWLEIDVAIKIFYGTNNPDFAKEVPILAGLSHPNIVSFFGHGNDWGEDFIVMELMDGDLFSLLKERLRKDRTRSPFSTFEEFDIMLQIAEAMDYLHEMRVLHRDLRSANILVRFMKSTNTEGYEYVQVKVSDFGLSRTKEFSMTHSNMTPNMGASRWMAPELIKHHNSNDNPSIVTSKNEELVENYPFKCDVYSFGMVCLEILTGDVPFPEISKPSEVKTAVCAGERPQLPDRCHEQLKALIKGCWNAKASSRPSFGDICMELRYLKSLHLD